MTDHLTLRQRVERLAAEYEDRARRLSEEAHLARDRVPEPSRLRALVEAEDCHCHAQRLRHELAADDRERERLEPERLRCLEVLFPEAAEVIRRAAETL